MFYSLLLLVSLVFASPAHHGDGGSRHQPAHHAQAHTQNGVKKHTKATNEKRRSAHPRKANRGNHAKAFNHNRGHHRQGRHQHRQYRNGRQMLVTTFWIGPVFINLVTTV